LLKETIHRYISFERFLLVFPKGTTLKEKRAETTAESKQPPRSPEIDLKTCRIPTKDPKTTAKSQKKTNKTTIMRLNDSMQNFHYTKQKVKNTHTNHKDEIR